MQQLLVDEGRVIAGIANRSGGRPLQFQDRESLIAHATGASSEVRRELETGLGLDSNQQPSG